MIVRCGLERVSGLSLIYIYCIIIVSVNAMAKTGRDRLIVDEDNPMERRVKNVSSECYISRRECDTKCAVVCEEIEDCDGVMGVWYRCSFNYWLVMTLMVVMALFLIVLLVACQCVDKGQGCHNVDLYPRILGNHRRGQRRGINTVQYFTAVRAGRNQHNRKSSMISHSSSFSPRPSVSSQTPLETSAFNFRYL